MKFTRYLSFLCRILSVLWKTIFWGVFSGVTLTARQIQLIRQRSTLQCASRTKQSIECILLVSIIPHMICDGDTTPLILVRIPLLWWHHPKPSLVLIPSGTPLSLAYFTQMCNTLVRTLVITALGEWNSFGSDGWVWSPIILLDDTKLVCQRSGLFLTLMSMRLDSLTQHLFYEDAILCQHLKMVEQLDYSPPHPASQKQDRPVNRTTGQIIMLECKSLSISSFVSNLGC